MSDQPNETHAAYQTRKNEPVARHADGRLKTAVWAKEGGSNGPIYNATLSWSYQDKDGTWQDTTLIPGHELLRADRLLEKSYDSIRELKDHDRAAYVEQQQAAQKTKSLSKAPSVWAEL